MRIFNLHGKRATFQMGSHAPTGGITVDNESHRILTLFAEAKSGYLRGEYPFIQLSELYALGYFVTQNFAELTLIGPEASLDAQVNQDKETQYDSRN